MYAAPQARKFWKQRSPNTDFSTRDQQTRGLILSSATRDPPGSTLFRVLFRRLRRRKAHRSVSGAFGAPSDAPHPSQYFWPFFGQKFRPKKRPKMSDFQNGQFGRKTAKIKGMAASVVGKSWYRHVFLKKNDYLWMCLLFWQRLVWLLWASLRGSSLFSRLSSCSHSNRSNFLHRSIKKTSIFFKTKKVRGTLHDKKKTRK